MSLRIGRITGLAEPTEPPGWTNNVDGSISIVGNYRATSVTDGLVKRDQLLGYQFNGDEPIVPVIMDNEPRVTGYYRVLDVAVATDKFTRLGGNLYAFQVTLVPVQGFTQPIFESILSDALLTNAVGAVAADHAPFHGYPLVATEYSQFTTGGYATSTRSSADGTMNIWCKAAGDATLMNTPAKLYLTPANFYVGSCVIEQGSTLQPVVGRNLQIDLVNWRLSNGLVRVTPNVTAGKLDIAHWKGAAWATAKTYKFTEANGGRGLITGWVANSILRNSVEECIIRLSAVTATVPSDPIYLDISLRRGDRLARIYISTGTSLGGAPEWSAFRDTVEAATAITYGAVTLGGIRATANDADGNRYVLLSYQTSASNDLVNGGITETASVARMDVGIGSEIAGSGAAAIDTATVLARQYIAAQTESQRVVSR